jgi:hypothetical protein
MTEQRKESKYIYYEKAGNGYQLTHDFITQMTIAPGYAGKSRSGLIEFTADGWMTQKSGYWWNGANVVIDDDRILPASCGHDGQGELIDEGLLPVYIYRDAANQWFYLRMRNDGVLDFRAFYCYQGVDKFYKPRCTPEIVYRAPIPFPGDEKPLWNHPLIGRPA